MTIVVLLAACGGDGPPSGVSATLGGPDDPQPPPGLRPELTVLPVDLATTATLEPLGHLAPPPHTLPVNHVYFYGWAAYQGGGPTLDSVPRTVYAPATGVVRFPPSAPGVDGQLEVRVTTTFSYYFGHILLRPPGLKVGDIVHAGDVLGTTNPPSALDLGVYDTSLPPLAGFVNPTRYIPSTLYCVNPFKAFVEPLRSQLYAKQYRVASAPADARIDFDIPGRLIGNWFEQSVPNTPDSQGPAGWPKSLAFVYDNYDPSRARIAIGGTIAGIFVGTTPAAAPRFESVSVASGKVTYSIRYTEATDVQWGLMIVQMLADDRMKVEVFDSPTMTSAEFDSKAFIYLR